MVIFAFFLYYWKNQHLIPIRKAPTIPYVSQKLSNFRSKSSIKSSSNSNLVNNTRQNNETFENNTKNGGSLTQVKMGKGLIGERQFLGSTNQQFLTSRCDFIENIENGTK